MLSYTFQPNRLFPTKHVTAIISYVIERPHLAFSSSFHIQLSILLPRGISQHRDLSFCTLSRSWRGYHPWIWSEA